MPDHVSAEEEWTCPWAKVDPDHFLLNPMCCSRKKWQDLRSFIRHHTIGSHRNHNRTFHLKGLPCAVDDRVFEELDAWSARTKEWRTKEDFRARWFEVYDIIAKWLSVEKPADLDPEWTKTWYRKVLDETEPVETVHRAISSDNVRHEAQYLVDRINRTKKDMTEALNSLQDLHIAIAGIYIATEARYAQELHELRTLLKSKVRLLDCGPAFISQMESDDVPIPGVTDFGSAATSRPGNSVQPHNQNLTGATPDIASGMYPETFDAPASNFVADPASSLSGYSHEPMGLQSVNTTILPPGTLDSLSEGQSVPISSAYSGHRLHSSNTTFSELRNLDETFTQETGPVVDSVTASDHSIKRGCAEDFPASEPMDTSIFTDFLEDSDMN